jgi:hypothetical protein
MSKRLCISTPEIQALVSRLRARGTSSLFIGQPELKSDLLLAAAVLAAIVHSKLLPEERLRLDLEE